MITTRNCQKIIIFITLALLVLAPAGPTAFADEFDCFGTLGAVTVDNLRVPQAVIFKPFRIVAAS